MASSKILSLLPKPNQASVKIRINTAAQKTLRQNHPWLYDKSITRQSHEGLAGDLAAIYDSDNHFLAIGLYDPFSPIRVRVLEHKNRALIDKKWLTTRIKDALDLRRPLINTATTGYRLIHGENDRLPGVILDKYDNTLVLKLYSFIWMPHLLNLVECICELFPGDRLILRLSRALIDRKEHLHGLFDGMILQGRSYKTPVVFLENGLKFHADPIKGQKTGFFLDQRDNRALLEKMCDGKTVLDTFSYTGAFSVYAARGGARQVTSVDLVSPALRLAERNMVFNFNYPAVKSVKHELICADAFEALKKFHDSNRKFDVVVIDPPSFAKAKEEIKPAIFAYAKLTKLGLSVLKEGGVFVQSSCSSHVDAEQFFYTVLDAAKSVRRPFREIKRTAHPIDHPVGFPEGRYLKCIFASA